MSFFIQSGEGLNLLARAAAVKAPVATWTIDPNYPPANLYDGRPSQYAKASAGAPGVYVLFDLNLIANGDGEGTDYTGWVVTATGAGTPTLTQSLVSPYAGSGSNQLQATGGGAFDSVQATYAFSLRAGEKARIYTAGLVTTAPNIDFKLRNKETGRYLQSGGTWGASTAFKSYTTGSFVDDQTSFTMPDVETGGGLWQRLELIVTAGFGATIDAKFEVKLVVGWDLVALFGHLNTPVNNRFILEYQALAGDDPGDSFSAAASAFTWKKATPSGAFVFPDAELQQPAVWNLTTVTRYERWVRFKPIGLESPPGILKIGELILAQAEDIPQQPRLGVQVDNDMAGQIRHETGAGDVWVYNRTPWRRRRITLSFQTQSPELTGDDPGFRALSNALIDRTHGGRYPVLLIPFEHDPRLVMYGSVSGSWSWSHNPPARTVQVDIREYPIPGLHHTLSA